jgi:hypothetical protein
MRRKDVPHPYLAILQDYRCKRHWKTIQLIVLESPQFQALQALQLSNPFRIK